MPACHRQRIAAISQRQAWPQWLALPLHAVVVLREVGA